eukprot:scaffold41510_cov16-Prasinocladus_malaysianus.AAC.2
MPCHASPAIWPCDQEFGGPTVDMVKDLHIFLRQITDHTSSVMEECLTSYQGRQMHSGNSGRQNQSMKQRFSAAHVGAAVVKPYN